MRVRRFRGVVAARYLLFVCLAASGASAQFQISESGLTLDGSPFRVQGVHYSNAAIGETGFHAFEGAGCRYARDFPLIAGTGANTVATAARVEPSDWAFESALISNGLYWLAGFPLTPYYDPGASLSAETAAGASLRERILSDFTAWAAAWAPSGRVVAFVFGDREARVYNSKFAGSPSDFYTLANEAARRLAAAGVATPVTTRVADAVDVGDPSLGADDVTQTSLAFWSIDETGRSALGPLFSDLRRQTAKPVLIAGFGVDAYDQPSGTEDAQAQAEVLASLAGEINFAVRRADLRTLGGVYNGFVDEWHRGSADPLVHGVRATPRGGSPDGAVNPGWVGLFGAVRTGVDGLDSLRPRRAYFELASFWNGRVPEELTLGGQPRAAPDGLVNMASGFPILGRGGLFSVLGSELTFESRTPPSAAELPLNLGAVSACLGGEPAPLTFAAPEEIRAQVPWDLDRGETEAIVFRGGVGSNRVTGVVEAAAPGILSRGVFRPGLPCPVDEFNGVRPGQVLEVYGTGLGVVSAAASTGQAPPAPALTAGPTRALWRGIELEVLYSGLFPGVVGVYQTNVRLPDRDVPAGPGELRLEAGGFFSNAYLMTVAAHDEPARFGLDGPHPGELIVQGGGSGRSAEVEVLGAGAFCSLVRFRVEGAPPGVEVRIPVGLPGQRVPLTVAAEPGSPRLTHVPVRLVGFAPGQDEVGRDFEITVLPSSGDIRLEISSAGWLTGTPGASFAFDEHRLFQDSGNRPGRGVNVLTVDDATGVLGDLRTFDTWASADEAAALENFLLSLTEGTLVLLAVADDGFLQMTDRTREIIRETTGARLIDRLDYQWSWALMGRVGAERPIDERLAEHDTVEIDRILSFPLPPM